MGVHSYHHHLPRLGYIIATVWIVCCVNHCAGIAQRVNLNGQMSCDTKYTAYEFPPEVTSVTMMDCDLSAGTNAIDLRPDRRRSPGDPSAARLHIHFINVTMTGTSLELNPPSNDQLFDVTLTIEDCTFTGMRKAVVFDSSAAVDHVTLNITGTTVITASARAASLISAGGITNAAIIIGDGVSVTVDSALAAPNGHSPDNVAAATASMNSYVVKDSSITVGAGATLIAKHANLCEYCAVASVYGIGDRLEVQDTTIKIGRNVTGEALVTSEEQLCLVASIGAARLTQGSLDVKVTDVTLTSEPGASLKAKGNVATAALGIVARGERNTELFTDGSVRIEACGLTASAETKLGTFAAAAVAGVAVNSRANSGGSTLSIADLFVASSGDSTLSVVVHHKSVGAILGAALVGYETIKSTFFTPHATFAASGNHRITISTGGESAAGVLGAALTTWIQGSTSRGDFNVTGSTFLASGTTNIDATIVQTTSLAMIGAAVLVKGEFASTALVAFANNCTAVSTGQLTGTIDVTQGENAVALVGFSGNALCGQSAASLSFYVESTSIAISANVQASLDLYHLTATAVGGVATWVLSKAMVTSVVSADDLAISTAGDQSITMDIQINGAGAVFGLAMVSKSDGATAKTETFARRSKFFADGSSNASITTSQHSSAAILGIGTVSQTGMGTCTATVTSDDAQVSLNGRGELTARATSGFSHTPVVAGGIGIATYCPNIATTQLDAPRLRLSGTDAFKASAYGGSSSTPASALGVTVSAVCDKNSQAEASVKVPNLMIAVVGNGEARLEATGDQDSSAAAAGVAVNCDAPSTTKLTLELPSATFYGKRIGRGSAVAGQRGAAAVLGASASLGSDMTSATNEFTANTDSVVFVEDVTQLKVTGGVRSASAIAGFAAAAHGGQPVVLADVSQTKFAAYGRLEAVLDVATGGATAAVGVSTRVEGGTPVSTPTLDANGVVVEAVGSISVSEQFGSGQGDNSWPAVCGVRAKSNTQTYTFTANGHTIRACGVSYPNSSDSTFASTDPGAMGTITVEASPVACSTPLVDTPATPSLSAPTPGHTLAGNVLTKMLKVAECLLDIPVGPVTPQPDTAPPQTQQPSTDPPDNVTQSTLPPNASRTVEVAVPINTTAPIIRTTEAPTTNVTILPEMVSTVRSNGTFVPFTTELVIRGKLIAEEKVCVRVTLSPPYSYAQTALTKLKLDASKAPSIQDSTSAVLILPLLPQMMEVCFGPLKAPPRDEDETLEIALTDRDSVVPTAPDAWGGLRLEVRVKAEPFDGQTGLETAGGVTTIATGAGTAFGGGPGTAAAAQRQQLLGKVLVCPRPLEFDPPAVEESPFGWGVGDSMVRHMIGMAYGNALLCVGWAVVLMFIVEIITQAATVPAEMPSRLYAMTQVSFPGKLVPFWMFFYQPMMSGALAGATHGTSTPGHQAVCALLALVLLGVFVVLPLMVARAFKRETSKHSMAPAVFVEIGSNARKRRARGPLGWVLGCEGHWVSRFGVPPKNPEEGAAWTTVIAERCGPVFGDFRPAAELTVVYDTMLATMGAAIMAYSPVTTTECLWVYGGALGVFFGAALLAITRPYQRSLDNVMYLLVAWLQFAAAIATVSAVWRSDGEVHGWEQALMETDVALRVIVLVWTAMQIAESLHEFLSSRKDKQAIEDLEGGLRAAHNVRYVAAMRLMRGIPPPTPESSEDAPRSYPPSSNEVPSSWEESHAPTEELHAPSSATPEVAVVREEEPAAFTE